MRGPIRNTRVSAVLVHALSWKLLRLSCRTLALAGCLIASCSPSFAEEASLTSLRYQTRELLKEEATLEQGSGAKDAAIAALCDLYVILRSDPRYSGSDMLRGDAAKVRRRLITIADRRAQRLEREAIARPESLAAVVDAAVQRCLAQRENEQARLPAVSETESFSSPHDPVPAALGGAPLGDNPWGLVELIQRVIDPDLWDVHGGTATIQYFAIRRVLVIRATTDTHEKIRELLMALR